MLKYRRDNLREHGVLSAVMKTSTYILGVLSVVVVSMLAGTAVAQDGGSQSVSELLDEIAERDRMLGEKDKALAELKTAFEDISEAFRQKATTLTESESQEAIKAAIAAKDEAWAQRDEALKARDEALAQRDEAQKARDDASLDTAEKIRMLEEKLAEKQDSLDKVQRAIAIKDGEITDLQMALASASESTRKEKLTLAYNIGCIYKAGRQYSKAEAEFLKALKYAPDDPGVHYNLGVLYDDNLGDSKKARHHYQRFLSLAPNDTDAPKVIQWLSELQ